MSLTPRISVRMLSAAVCLGGLVTAASALFPATASADRLRRCADEGGICRLPYPAEVVYGAQGDSTSRFFDRSAVPCTNRVFGDPAPDRKKACYIVMRGRGDYGGDDNGPRNDYGRWVACASENDYCEFDGRRAVRFGARGQYTVGVFRDGVQCDNDSFGDDPAPGIPKRCYVRQ